MTLAGIGPNRRMDIDELIVIAVREAMTQGKKSSLTLNFDFVPNTENGSLEVNVGSSVKLPKRGGGTAFFWANESGERGKYSGEITPFDERRKKKAGKPELSAIEGGGK
jgi:hypothetical protein